MTINSSYQRKDIFKQLEKETLDVLIIGGGITGAGISLDAVTRGLKTGLVDMQDFSSGTSSRSTKLVHGGLRYLRQFEIKLVAEVGRERAIVYENGAHVTTPEWMMLPLYKGGTFGPYTTNIGLLVYDYLAGVKKDERRKMLSPKEVLRKEPLLKEEGLKGAGYYVEYKTDDARLTIEVLKKAIECGAHAVNYGKVIRFLYDNVANVIGVLVEDQISGETYEVYAKKIINATGPWVDQLREMDGSKHGKTLTLTKGAHLVFSKRTFPLQQAIYFDAPDGRMIFAIPRNNKTYVGTTETSYHGALDKPILTKKDCEYLLDAINATFPSLHIDVSDIQSSWTGLRPLIAEEGKDPNEISRKDEIFLSESGLLSIAGGKLTGYRKMAEQVMDQVVKQFAKEYGILYSDSETYHLPISGGQVGGSKGFQQFKKRKVSEGIALGIEEDKASQLVHRYGSNIDIIYRIYQDRQDEAKKEAIDSIVFSELVYALEYELAYKPSDFFIRRTGALFFEIDWVQTHKENAITYMANKLHWNSDQLKHYTDELEQLLYQAAASVKE